MGRSEQKKRREPKELGPYGLQESNSKTASQEILFERSHTVCVLDRIRICHFKMSNLNGTKQVPVCMFVRNKGQHSLAAKRESKTKSSK